jgi:hypothetical protein
MNTSLSNSELIMAGLNQVLTLGHCHSGLFIICLHLLQQPAQFDWPGFAVLLACMCFTYAGDVALFKADSARRLCPG